MKTEASRLFDELNRRYWHGRLPRYRVIRRAALRCLGGCNNRTRMILLRRDLAGEALRLTLLHEMCHIGPDVGYDHGPHFLRKLRRLVRLGEPKLLEEGIERYDGTAVARYIREQEAKTGKKIPEISWRDVVLSDVDAASFEARLFRRRWPTIRRMLANKYEMTEARLQRDAPWAEREWKRLSQATREYDRIHRLFEEVKKGRESALRRLRKLLAEPRKEKKRGAGLLAGPPPLPPPLKGGRSGVGSA